MATSLIPAPAAAPHDWVGDYAGLPRRPAGTWVREAIFERWAVAAHLIGEDDKLVALRDRA